MLQIGIRLHDVNTRASAQEQTLEARAAKARDEGFCCVHLAPQKVMKGITFDGPAFHEGLAIISGTSLPGMNWTLLFWAAT